MIGTISLPTSSTVVVLNNNIIRIGGKAYASNIQFNNNGNLMIDSGGSLNVGSIEGNSYIPSLHITSGGSIKSTGLINSVRLDISGGNIQVNAISNSSISGYGDISSGFYTNTQFSTIDNSNPIPTTSTNTVQKLKVSGTFFRNDAFTVSHGPNT